jgi:hypothetical protein
MAGTTGVCEGRLVMDGEDQVTIISVAAFKGQHYHTAYWLGSYDASWCVG